MAVKEFALLFLQFSLMRAWNAKFGSTGLTCYLYTCFYIWSASDFPLDIVFECLWGKHQGFIEWLGFLKICLFLYLFHMNWKFCQTHFDCMENMFQSQKTAKKKPKQGSCISIELGKEKSRRPPQQHAELAPVSFECCEKPSAYFPRSRVTSCYKVKSCRHRGRMEKMHTASYSRMVISDKISVFYNTKAVFFPLSFSL